MKYDTKEKFEKEKSYNRSTDLVDEKHTFAVSIPDLFKNLPLRKPEVTSEFQVKIQEKGRSEEGFTTIEVHLSFYSRISFLIPFLLFLSYLCEYLLLFIV